MKIFFAGSSGSDMVVPTPDVSPTPEGSPEHGRTPGWSMSTLTKKADVHRSGSPPLRPLPMHQTPVR